jgi:hypothetical protein
MNKEKEKELWRKIDAYIQQFSSYIVKRANSTSNMRLALGALHLVTLHQTMALVLAPKCTGEYQAQVDALKGTVDKVLDFLHGTRTGNETADQLYDGIFTEIENFLAFTLRCAGFEVEIVDTASNEMLRRAFNGKDVSFLTIVGQLPQVPVQPPSPSVLEQTKELVNALTGYHNKLVEYILQEVGTDRTTLMALKGFEIAQIFTSMAVPFTQPCPWLFIGALEATVDELKNMVRLLNEDPHGELDYGFWAFAELDYIAWRQVFLHNIARCFGVDLDVELMPKGNGVELEIVKYGPLTEEDTSDVEN